MGSCDSFSMLILLTSEQEQCIKELFKRNRWSYVYKVLPQDFSYLWTLDIDEENHSVSRMPQIGNNETVADKVDKGLTASTLQLKNKSEEFHGMKDPQIVYQTRDRVYEDQMNDIEQAPAVREILKVTELENEGGCNKSNQTFDSSDTEDYETQLEVSDEPQNISAVVESETCTEAKNKPKGHSKTAAKHVQDSSFSVSLNQRKTPGSSKLKSKSVGKRKLGREKEKMEHLLNSKLASDRLKPVNLNHGNASYKSKLESNEVVQRKLRKVKEKEEDLFNKKLSSERLKISPEKTNENHQKTEESQITKLSSDRCNGCGKHLYKYKNNEQTFCKFCREKCRFCDKSYVKTVTGLKRLEVHLRTHQGVRPYKCSECDKTFTAQEYLLRHKGRKHNPEPTYHVCKICSKSFTKDGLRSHMVNMHSGRTTVFQCDLCGNVFRYKGSLTQHKISVHAEQRNFTCDVCSRTFTSSHNLRLHKVRHEADQKVVCSICGKTLQGGSGLKEHMRRHANQRQFECKKCTKSFYAKRDLLNHIKIHTGERPFECHLCLYACAIKGNLTKHMKKHRKGNFIPEHMYKGHCVIDKVVENTQNKHKGCENIIKANGNIEQVAGQRGNSEKENTTVESQNISTSNLACVNIQPEGTPTGHTLKHDLVNTENQNEVIIARIPRSDALIHKDSGDDTGQICIDTTLNFYADQKHTEKVDIHCDNQPGEGLGLVVDNYDSNIISQISNLNDANYGIQLREPANVYKANQNLEQRQEEPLYHNANQYFS